MNKETKSLPFECDYCGKINALYRRHFRLRKAANEFDAPLEIHVTFDCDRCEAPNNFQIED